MKLLLLISIFLCSVSTAVGQVEFHSPITQRWPTLFTTDFEEVDRSIWISNQEITILTETPNGKEIETLKIKSFEHSGNSIIFTCTNWNNRELITVIVQDPNRLTAIDIYRVSPKTGEEVQMRLHLD